MADDSEHPTTLATEEAVPSADEPKKSKYEKWMGWSRFGAMFKKFAQDTKTKMQAVSKPKTQSDSAQPEGEESHVERVPSTTEDQNIEQQPTDKPGSSGGAAAKMSAFSAALKHTFSRKAQTTDSVDGTAEDQDTGDDDAKSNEAGGKIGYFAAAFKTKFAAMKQAATASKVDLEPQGPPYTDAITETYVRQYGANNSMEWHNITANEHRVEFGGYNDFKAKEGPKGNYDELGMGVFLTQPKGPRVIPSHWGNTTASATA